MVELRVYKTNGEIKITEADEKAVVTFRDDGKDDTGTYFYAIADKLQDAFSVLSAGIQALKANLRSTIGMLDSISENIALNEVIVGLSGGFEAKRQTLNE